MSAVTPPDETQMKSMPSPLSALAIATASSGVSPPSRQSLPVMRAPSGTPFGTTARTARAIDERKAQAVLERAAVLVGALVGDRRHEAVRQIAVRHVQLDLVEADAQRALGGGDEGLAHALHVGFGHFARRVPALARGQRRRRDGLPRVLVGLERAAAFPRPLRRGLAAGMRDLDAELGGAGAAR